MKRRAAATAMIAQPTAMSCGRISPANRLLLYFYFTRLQVLSAITATCRIFIEATISTSAGNSKLQCQQPVSWSAREGSKYI